MFRSSLNRGALAVAALAVALALAGLASTLTPAAQGQATVNVTIKNIAFVPQNITVVIGVNNTVTWTNSDPQSLAPYHTVTPDPGDPTTNWGSGHLTTGQSYTYTFTTPGTYGYYCTLHPFAKGTVKVLSAGPSAATTTASGASPSSGVPEFPFSLASLVVAALVAATYLLARRTSKLDRGPRRL
jgi:plastocyanin